MHRFVPIVLVPLLMLPAVATARSSPSEPDDGATSALDTIVVHGRAIELIGEANAASEGVVGYADFEDRPLSRVGELVEVIPGVIATQHSGEGKANQYFLRGFNLDHGTDFSVSIDSVPANLRTHGHGQGYLDLNFVIPEVIERVDFRKGPYSASTGDFSAAGSACYSTYDKLRKGFVELAAGEFGYVRGVGAASFDLTEDTTAMLALEVESYDGPWVLDQDLEKLNAFAKLVRDAGAWRFELSGTAYDSSWTSTDQVPLRAIDSGAIDRFGVIDPDLGGETRRLGVTGQAVYRHGDGAETQISAYAVDYDFALFSNFTYFLNDPVNGDEFEQLDERIYYGASFAHDRSLTNRLDLRFGAVQPHYSGPL